MAILKLGIRFGRRGHVISKLREAGKFAVQKSGGRASRTFKCSKAEICVFKTQQGVQYR